MLKTVYFTLVESLIRYGLLVWGAANFSFIDPIFKLQKRILKIMGNREIRFPTIELFIENRVLSVRQLYILLLVNYMKKNENRNNVVNHTHNTRIRERNYQDVPRMNTAFGQRSIVYLGPTIFNRIPVEIKEEENINRFKRKIRHWLLSIGIHCSEELIVNRI